MQACELKTQNRALCNSTDLFTAETPRIDAQGRDHSHECWRCGMTMCNAHVAPQPLQRSGENGQRELAKVCLLCWIEHAAWMRLLPLVRSTEREASCHDPLGAVLRLEELIETANDMTVAIRDAERRAREQRWSGSALAIDGVLVTTVTTPVLMSNTANGSGQIEIRDEWDRPYRRNRLIDEIEAQPES